MAYDLKKLKGKVRDRYDSHTLSKDLVEKNKITDNQMQLINRDLNVLSELGIVLDKDGKPPVRNGVPSMFIMQKDENGVERPVDINKTGIDMGSRDFWHQAQLGNVFAYPAGSKDPVQINANFTSYIPKLEISAPIAPENMPVRRNADNAAHRYNAPNWFTRTLNKIFPGFRKKDCEIYNSKQALKAQFADLGKKRTAGVFDKETVELSVAEEKAAAAKEKKEIRQNVEFLQKKLENKTKGMTVYRDMTAPQPVLHEEYLRKNGGAGFYSQEEFNSLKPINKKIEDYTIGGKTLSADEYCGLVAACSLDPKNALPGYTTSNEYDPTAVQTITDLGYGKERAEEIVTASFTTMITTDLMKGDLRGSQGNVLPLTVNPARQDVFDILDKYKNGDKEPLAKAIARGITVCVADTGDSSGEIGHNRYNHSEFATATADLLDRDPELKQLAMKNGLEEGDIEACRGMANMSKADTARRKAQLELAKAANGEITLTTDQKRKYAEEIVTANLMESKMTIENSMEKQKNGDAWAEESARLTAEAKKNKLELTKDQIHYYSAHPEERPMPPKGKFYNDQVTTLMGGRKGEFNVHADTLLNVSDAEGVAEMENIAKKIVAKNGLAQLEPKDLSKALERTGKFNGTSLIAKGQEVLESGLNAGKPGPEKAKELEEEALDPLNTAIIMKH